MLTDESKSSEEKSETPDEDVPWEEVIKKKMLGAEKGLSLASRRKGISRLRKKYGDAAGIDSSNPRWIKESRANEADEVEDGKDDSFSLSQFFHDMKTIWTSVSQDNDVKEMAINITDEKILEKTKTKDKNMEDSEEIKSLNNNILALPAPKEDYQEILEVKSVIADSILTNSEEEETSIDTKDPVPVVDVENDILKKTNAYCWACGWRGEENERLLNMCRGCRTARYCSEQCHKDDWKQHKKFCLKVSRDKVRPKVSGSEVD